MKELSDIYTNIKQKPQQPFLVSESSTISYGDLLTRISLFVGLFEHHQRQTEQRIVICSDDDEFITCAVVSAFFHGITSIVLTPETSLSRLEGIIRKAKPTLILLDEQLQSVWQLKGEFDLFTIVKQQQKGSSLLNRFKRKAKTGWLSTLETYPPMEPALPSDKSLNCFLNFTSGTTGDAKGVQITYQNLLCHMQTLTNVFDYSAGSRILNNMILAHADGLLQGPILTLYNNCTLYRPYNMDVQNLELLLNTIFRERITHMLTVPTILSFVDRFAEHNDYFHGDEFRHLISVAGMLDNNIWQRLEKRLGVRISNIYGLTETVAGGIFCGPKDDSYCLGTIGKPLDMEVRIVKGESEQCEVNEQGELWLKGDNVFPGYFENIEKTNESFADGWFRTGDIASVDEHGFFRICGRVKELIISGGFNIHPAEVNEALLRHSQIAEVATLGMPDPDWQEIVVSAVVLKEGEEVGEQQLITHARQWLEYKKVPRKIHFMKSLPRGDAGKVSLPQLQQQLQLQISDNNSRTEVLNEASLLTLASEVFQVDIASLSLQSKVGDTTGWDSLGHLTLIVRIEEITKKTLTSQQIMAIQTLANVLDLVHE